MTFWKTASKAQKLAQIDAGIELGMTARQVGMNVGIGKRQVLYFAEEHGRKFPHQTTRPFGEAARLAAFRSRGVDNERMERAFNIFGAKESKWEIEL